MCWLLLTGCYVRRSSGLVDIEAEDITEDIGSIEQTQTHRQYGSIWWGALLSSEAGDPGADY